MHYESVTRLRTFDFHDGEVLCILHDGKNIKMQFKNWQEKTFEFVFMNVIALSIFEFPSWPEANVEIGSSSALIKQSLENLRQLGANSSELIPEKYLEFSLKNDGHPLSIVFENVLITEVN